MNTQTNVARTGKSLDPKQVIGSHWVTRVAQLGEGLQFEQRNEACYQHDGISSRQTK